MSLCIVRRRAGVALYDRASRTLSDPMLRSWAARNLPRLQNPLAAAQQLPLTVQA